MKGGNSVSSDTAAQEDLLACVPSITGDQGAHVIFDPVGGDYINTTTGKRAWRRRVLLDDHCFEADEAPSNVAAERLGNTQSRTGFVERCTPKHPQGPLD